ncbi:metal-dependent transcriptional regulator [Corynebacterium sp. S7]
MHIRDLPERSQDYIKVIWDITEYSDQPASLGEIAQRMEQKTSTASEAIKRLGKLGLVSHEPYSGIQLTKEGTDLAIQIVRRHRLVETFLVTVLGYSWDEVHSDADLLEHAVSDRLLARIDAKLGQPAFDPHGDPIPTADGYYPEISTRALVKVAPGTTVTIAQVNDDDPELLRYLASHGLSLGSQLTVIAPVTAGILQVENEQGEKIPLAETTLRSIRVKP